MDVGVAGPDFGASSVPSLKRFLRDIAHSVPSPQGGTVYDAWKLQSESARSTRESADEGSFAERRGDADHGEVHVGDLGSGSDYSAFLQHLGVPSTDIGSNGPYGVYHSVFDNYAWFTKFADPTFAYEQQMARIFGLEVLRMAQADALPFDYESYGNEVRRHLEKAQRRAQELGWKKQPDFTASLKAAGHLAAAGRAVRQAAGSATGAQLSRINAALMGAERAMLGKGLPHRPWFRHTIYAPGEYTGYAAVVIPGVNESMDRDDLRGGHRVPRRGHGSAGAGGVRAGVSPVGQKFHTSHIVVTEIARHLVTGGGTTPESSEDFNSRVVDRNGIDAD